MAQEKMNIETARLIREIKKGCTYRRLSEIYHSKNMGDGDELCFEAFKVLYPECKSHPLELSPGEINYLYGEDFKRDNKSKFGDFYWWE